jgi:hypothetical protein
MALPLTQLTTEKLVAVKDTHQVAVGQVAQGMAVMVPLVPQAPTFQAQAVEEVLIPFR